MKRLTILAAAGLMVVLGSAAAQTRDGRDGARPVEADRSHPGGSDRGGARHWDRGFFRGDRGNGRGDVTHSRGDQNHWRGDQNYARDPNHRRGDHNHWRGNHNHWRGNHNHWRDTHNHWRGHGYSRPYDGWRGGYPRYSWVSPYAWGGYPGWAYGGSYAPPLYSYVEERPFYVERVVEREPIYVERVVEREPIYVEREVAPPPPRERREPSYAQVIPVPRAEPKPPPARLERYTLSATELFEFDKAVLKLPQPKLDEIADAMVRNPQIDRVNVTGYTDRIGTDAYNMKLSRQRADAVKAYLAGKGVAPGRLVAVGKGEANPVVQCNDKDQAKLIKCLEPNRRVEVEQITVERRATR